MHVSVDLSIRCKGDFRFVLCIDFHDSSRRYELVEIFRTKFVWGGTFFWPPLRSLELDFNWKYFWEESQKMY